MIICLGRIVVVALISVVLATSAKTESPQPSLVREISNNDIEWSVNEADIATVSLSGATGRLADSRDPPFTEILSAMSDKTKFVAALVVLRVLLEPSARPVCIRRTESGALVKYDDLEVTIDQNGAAQYHNIDHAHKILVWKWDEKGDRVRGLLMKWASHGKNARTQHNLPIRLSDRKRIPLDRLRNDDVNWICVGFGHVLPQLSGELRRIVENERPSIESLIDALSESDSFVAAHFVLCAEFRLRTLHTESISDGYIVMYNGLQIDVLGVDHEVSYRKSEQQRKELKKYWDRLVVQVPTM